MDHTRDNPLKRFTAFWIALLLVVAFAIACILVKLFVGSAEDEAYVQASRERLLVKMEILDQQADALNEEALAEKLADRSALLIDQPKPSAMPVPGQVPAPETTAPAEDKPSPETGS